MGDLVGCRGVRPELLHEGFRNDDRLRWLSRDKSTANGSDLAKGNLLIFMLEVKLVGDAFFAEPQDADIDLQFIFKLHGS